ncbi:hypothetical protein [Ruegeria arenilitoris]|uniref:hypothetical protein n=1 Tax=Ruegeria arenilitoris TaxID=1173585 RepID=UPI00147A4F36|nr:hypothetical protein [Ruegeria arenilitoris]
MSRTLILAVIVAGLGAGIYYYLNQPEPTPAERLQSAAQEAGEAVNDAVDAATEQANEAASSITEQATEAAEQAGQAATDLANQASDQVASLATQGQDLVNSWIEEGTLSVQNFDYDAIVASVQDSQLSQDLKTQALNILDEIKASPQLIAEKIEELRTLLTSQQ